MDRRQFIKTSLISGVSLFLIPNFLKADNKKPYDISDDIFDYSMPNKGVEQLHISWIIKDIKRDSKGSKEFESNYLKPSVSALQEHHLRYIRKGYKSKYIKIPNNHCKGEYFIKNGMKLRYVEEYDIDWDHTVARIDLLMVKV